MTEASSEHGDFHFFALTWCGELFFEKATYFYCWKISLPRLRANAVGGPPRGGAACLCVLLLLESKFHVQSLVGECLDLRLTKTQLNCSHYARQLAQQIVVFLAKRLGDAVVVSQNFPTHLSAWGNAALSFYALSRPFISLNKLHSLSSSHDTPCFPHKKFPILNH